MELSDSRPHPFKSVYKEEVDPGSRDKVRADTGMHLKRSIERLKLFAGVTEFEGNHMAIHALYRFKDAFLESQFNELRDYYTLPELGPVK